MKNQPASCYLCGETWPRDPRLEVACPVCHARVGNHCSFEVPSGHRRSAAFVGKQPHVEREELAIQRGFMTRECPKAPTSRETPVQQDLFGGARA